MIDKQFDTTTQFDKNLKRILKDRPELEVSIWQTVEFFLEDRTNPVLRDHPLKDSQHGFRSFTISLDLRVIYRETQDLYIFTNIGSHKEVYRIFN